MFDTEGGIVFVHKPGMRGEAGEPQPASNLKHAQKLGYQRCQDQVGAEARFRQRQRAAAGEPEPDAGDDDGKDAPPAKVTTAGVTETANNAKPGGEFPCPFDATHGPFRSERGLAAHVASKHPGQAVPE